MEWPNPMKIYGSVWLLLMKNSVGIYNPGVVTPGRYESCDLQCCSEQRTQHGENLLEGAVEGFGGVAEASLCEISVEAAESPLEERYPSAHCPFLIVHFGKETGWLRTRH